MRNSYLAVSIFIVLLLFVTACKSPVKQQEDKIYSRHLQRYVNLTIISTQMPDDKSAMNLLLYNSNNDLLQMNAREIIDSLYRKKLIQPLEMVSIDGVNEEEYGISLLSVPGKPGSKAGKYNDFVINELYPFIKKKSVVRKFRSVAICGNSRAGISAFDIAWQNADKIDKLGIFSGDFNYAGRSINKKDSQVNAVLEKINLSRKKPSLKYWLYAAENADSIPFNNTRQLINIIENKNAGISTGIQFVTDKNGNNNIVSWRQQFTAFLLWAFGK